MAHSDNSNPLLAALVAVVLVVHAGLLVWSAGRHSATSDEIIRLRAGFEHWQQGHFFANPGNPPLTDLIAAVPLLVSVALDESREVKTCIFDSKQIAAFVSKGRCCLIPFSVFGAWICYSWGRELFGGVAGFCSMVVWCVDPLILAHGALITGDMVATAIGIAAFFYFWRWLRQPCMVRLVVAAVALGAALLSKYSWVVMPLIWLPVVLAKWLASPRQERRELISQVAVLGIVTVYIVNLGFAFERSFQPLGTYEFKSRALRWLSFERCGSDTLDLPSWLSHLPVPLPRNYVMGIDDVGYHLQTVKRPTYFRGEFLNDNIRHFYLYALLVKMPLGTWVLLVVAVHARMTGGGSRVESSESRAGPRGGGTPGLLTLALSPDGKRSDGGKGIAGREGTTTVPAATGFGASACSNPGPEHDGTGRNARSAELPGAKHWFTDLMLWLPAITILVFVSWVTQIKMLRYILPMLPYVFIWIGHAFVWAHEGRWWRKTMVYGPLAWSVLSSLWVYPHSLSYFNEAAGGTANGHAHLIGASYDWGQDMLFLRDWREHHPVALPLYVACYSVAECKVDGNSPENVLRQGPQPGWYAVSASVLRGAWRLHSTTDDSSRSDFKYLELLIDEAPVARAGYSIMIFYLDCDKAKAMREKLGLEAIECHE